MDTINGMIIGSKLDTKGLVQVLSVEAPVAVCYATFAEGIRHNS